MKTRSVSLLLFWMMPWLAFAGNTFNVKDFGAVGDGKAIDSKAINEAIDAASEAYSGSRNVVYFPTGEYRCYSIRLKSHICLRFEQGAKIIAAKEPARSGTARKSSGFENFKAENTIDTRDESPFHDDRYDEAEPNLFRGEANAYQDFGHSHWQNSLIWGIGLEDIRMEGPGLIDGTEALSRGSQGGANKAIALKNCQNIDIQDIRILNAGHFAFLLTGVDHLRMCGILVDSNRDGFDIDACRDVEIYRCEVNTPNDDAIVLKSSFALGELRACEDIHIHHCQVSGYDVGSYLNQTYQTKNELAPDRDGPTGRIKFGTESNGGFRNIVIDHCRFIRSRGIALEAVDGAIIENIDIHHIQMQDICNAVLFLRVGKRNRGPMDLLTPSALRDVRIHHIKAENVDSRYPLLICGLPEQKIQNVTLDHWKVLFNGGLSLQDAASQQGANTFFHRTDSTLHSGPREPFDVPEAALSYPEPSVFGILPTSAMFLRHVDNLQLSHIQMDFAKEDSRPGIVTDDVTGLSMKKVKIGGVTVKE